MDVKIFQFIDKDGNKVAPLTPEEAIYDSNGVRLSTKLKNLDPTAISKALVSSVDEIENKRDEAVEDIQSNQESVNQNTGISEYPNFSQSETYEVDDIVLYTDGLLYKFTSKHSPGAWNMSEVKRTSLKEQMGNIELAQELSTEEGSENKVISQKTVSEEFFKLLGTSDVVLYEKKELGVREKVTLPTNLKDDDVVQIELLTEGLTSNILWSNEFSINNGALKVHFPRTFLYKFIKEFRFDFQGTEKISVKVTILKRTGLISNENTLLYRGAYANVLTISDYGLKVGDQLLIKNSKTESTGSGEAQVYVYKNTLGGDYIRVVFVGYETIVVVTDDMNSLHMLFPGGGIITSELEVWKLSEYNKNYNQAFFKQLCDYEFIACGDSITAWSAATDTGSEDIAKFDGWAYILAGHVGFKSFKNISVSGASYTQSSIYGSYAFSINRTIKNNLPEGFSGVFVLTGGTNDYDGKKSLGSCEETMAKTYEELDETNNTDNFSSICDGFRYCLETAIRKCSWKARIFVITCVPRNDMGDYTMAQMNEQLKLIAKAFNVPVIDMFSEISFRNGLDQFGQTWKLAEVTEEGGTENVHPNADAQQIMAQFIYSKLLTYIR